MNDQIALRMRGIAKKLSDFALGPIDLTFEKGYVYAIVGPNGAGKSTLFGMITGAIKSDEGTLHVFERTHIDDEVAIKKRIGYASTSHLWADADMRTIRDVIRFAKLWYENLDEDDLNRKLVQFELEPKMKLASLSMGMAQRLSIVMAMANDPDLLLLDEATNGLDFKVTQQVHDLLHAYVAREGKTIVLATHIPDEIRRLADFIVVVRNGKVLGTYEKDSLMNSWRRLLVDKLPEGVDRAPWLVHSEAVYGGCHIIVSAYPEAESALIAQGATIASAQALELQDIVTYILDHK